MYKYREIKTHVKYNVFQKLFFLQEDRQKIKSMKTPTNLMFLINVQ